MRKILVFGVLGILSLVIIRITYRAYQYRNFIVQENFDIFKMRPTGKNARTEKVLIKYEKEFPIQIVYFLKDTKVELLFSDSIALSSGSQMYVFTTGSLRGGVTGRHRVYGFHTEEYCDSVFIIASKEIFSKTTSLPQFSNYDYTVALYKQADSNRIIQFQIGRNSHEDRGLTTEKVYEEWKKEVVTRYSDPKSRPSYLSFLP